MRPSGDIGYGCFKVVSYVVLALMIVPLVIVPHSVCTSSTVQGVVQTIDGLPVADARVSLWEEDILLATTRTGSDGAFIFEGEFEGGYTVSVVGNLPETPGYDFVPARVGIRSGEEGVIKLRPGASVVLEGDVQFVETSYLPSSFQYSVLDPGTGEVMEVGGLSLIYGPSEDSLSQVLGLEAGFLIVPSGVPLGIRVEAWVLVDKSVVSKVFGISGGDGLVFRQGGLGHIDLREHSIPLSLEVLGTALGGVEDQLEEMDSLGFYVATEWGNLDSVSRSLSEARSLHREGRFIESYVACRRGYIDVSQIEARLVSMRGDASLSVYSILVFLTFASTTVAFLFSDRGVTKALGSVGLTVLVHGTLYAIYPGSSMVPFDRFVGVGVASALVSLAVAFLVPRLLKGRGRDGHLPVRNLIVPIFSMAKRDLLRRRLRFVFTLVSITVLVMSFVSLTSFSEGYGLVVKRVSGGSSFNGVLLRAPEYTRLEPVSIALEGVEVEWLEQQPEVVDVALKAENLPMLNPAFSIDGTGLYGLIGLDPGSEGAVTPLEGVMVEGGLPSVGGVAISEGLSRGLGVGLGGEVELSGVALRVEGVFDDEGVMGLREVDGGPFLPRKLVNLNPEGELPHIVVETCEPREAAMVHIETALRMPLVGVSRIVMPVSEGYDVGVFAERLALERGYQAWSASADGVFVARLGSYLEGKGLPLLVPWAIVVLNVVVTMLNSMFERRRDIHILSSVGLNPAQIAAIFVAEASIIGLAGGGLGYLGGLGVYRVMGAVGLTLQVRQKVSAFWSLASIGIANSAILMGALAALRGSVVITPSLMRRWRIDVGDKGVFEPYRMTIPVRLLPEEMDDFTEFVIQALRGLEDHPVRRTSSIKRFDLADGGIRVDFVYRTEGAAAGNFYTKNSLSIDRVEGGGVEVRLVSYGDQEWVHTTGSLVRLFMMRWSTLPRRHEGV